MSVSAHNFLDYAAYVGLRCVIALIQALPLSVCEWGAERLAWLVSQVLGFRRRVIDDNLRTAAPRSTEEERRRIALAMWRHLFLMVAEIAHTPRKVHRTNWRTLCDMPDVEPIVRILIEQRPTIIISGHYGNFELGGYLLGLFGFPTHTVARKLDNEYVDRFVNEFRGRTGQHMLDKLGSRDEIERILESGGTLTLLGDQAAGVKACWVNFFQRPASTHKAVSLFTLGYEAPTMVVATRRREKPLSYEVDLAGIVDPKDEDFELGSTTAMTEWFTHRLEKVILKAPEQYWWVHRRWKHEPPPRVARRLMKQSV